MRRLAQVLLVVLLVANAPPASAEEPRALIERAIKAVGGIEAVQRKPASHVKVKGKIFIGSEAVPLDGELFESGPRSKILMRLNMAGTVFRATIVENGEKSWRSLSLGGDKVEDFGKEDLEWQRISKYVDRVTDLAPLLADKEFTLDPLPEVKVEGQPAAGVKVSRKDHPDVSLYFDKDSGLLVKYAYRGQPTGKNPTKKDALHESVLSDYRLPDLASADEKILRAAKCDITGPALLAFVRARTLDAETLAKVKTLIRKLGDDSFKVRERASADLIALGSVAIPLLREAARDEDREVARRARQCLQRIGEDRSKAPVAAAIRLLGLRKPEGTAEVLLNYLPGANPEAAREARAALFAVAHRTGKPDRVLVRALEDKDPVRRQAAAAALGKDGGAYARQPGRRLFDPAPKIAHKHKGLIDGKPDLEIEISECQLFNALEANVFAKP